MKRIAIAFCLAALTTSSALAQNAVPCVPQTGRQDLRPIAATHTLPPYPRLAQHLGEEGTTQIKVLIGVDGVPTEVNVNKSSGSIRLDTVATAYVKAFWKWQQPRTPDCKPSQALTLVSVVWNLKDAGELDVSHYAEMDMALPEYPPGAAGRKEQGIVMLVVTVPPDGAAAQIVLSSSSGYPDLDAKAEEIIKARHPWKAAEINGKPVLTKLGILAVWTLPVPAKE